MGVSNTQLPLKCPSCTNKLSVQSLICESCKTTVTGLYELPVLLQLEKHELGFILSFVKKSGSLKEMAQEMGLSYPTVRNYLNDLIEKINHLEHENHRKET